MLSQLAEVHQALTGEFQRGNTSIRFAVGHGQVAMLEKWRSTLSALLEKSNA